MNAYLFASVRSAAGVVAVMVVPWAIRRVGAAVTGLQPDEWNRKFWEKVCAFAERRVAHAQVRQIDRVSAEDL